MAQIQRTFIDWQKPLLKEVVSYLLGMGESAHRVDLSGYTLCLPTARAGRRLMEMLVQACPPGRVLSPPKVTTPGQLPELLYAAGAEAQAQGLIARLARARALETMDKAALAKLIPHPPKSGQTGLWLRLAGEIERLAAELAADFKTPADVLETLGGPAGASLLFDDRERWEALVAHEAAFAKVMRDISLHDKNHARFEAVQQGERIFQGTLVLIGAPGLSALVKRMVETLVEPERVKVIVHAPEAIADRFDALGRLHVDVWARQEIAVEDEQILFANHPEEQARLAVGVIAHECGVEAKVKSKSGEGEGNGGEHLHPGPFPEVEGVRVDTDQITVGLGDAQQGQAVARALEAAGLSGRIAAGTPVRDARVCMMLEMLVSYLRERRTGDLARLARCVDIELWLRASGLDDTTAAEGEQGRRGGGVALMACLDESITRHLPMKASTAWPGDGESDKTARRIIELIDNQLTPEGWKHPRRMDEWVGPFIEMLKRVYGHRKLGNHTPEHQSVIVSLGVLREACAVVNFAEGARSVMPRVDFAGFVEAMLLGVEEAIPAASDPGSVELLGWLELPMDDAENLIVTGFNDGFVPESVTHDAMLPGSLRSAVGLADNTARLARDVYALSVILESRRSNGLVRLIACRRGQDERPMTPSRLLIQTADTQTVARRLWTFSDREGKALEVGGLVASGEESTFLPAAPTVTGEKRHQFRVTEFADYAACPYRYYLKQIRRLETQDDRAREMDPRAFGNLMHEVLGSFGTSELTGESNAEVIEGFLLHRLEEEKLKLLGKHPPAPAMIQLELMKQRLRGFARAQAQEAKAGWRVVKELVETRLEMEVALEDARVTFYGKVDRVDFSPEAGFRVLDYKTGNEARRPSAIYKADSEKEFAWRDYQLPLYQKLLEGWIASHKEYAGKPIRLGYFNLPRTAGAAGVTEADWEQDDIDRAMKEAKTIATRVREGIFWPPGAPPAYEDDFADLCHDNDIDRETALKRVSAKLSSLDHAKKQSPDPNPLPEGEGAQNEPGSGKGGRG